MRKEQECGWCIIEKGEKYFLKNRVENKHEGKKNVFTYKVYGKRIYNTILNKKEKTFTCDCTTPYVGKPTTKKYPFCSHCWASVMQYQHENAL